MSFAFTIRTQVIGVRSEIFFSRYIRVHTYQLLLPMEAVSGKVLKTLYSVSFELVRRKIVCNIEDGDVGLSILKDQLVTEFEEVNRKLDKLLDAPLKAAQIHMQRALSDIQCNDISGAKRLFELCGDKAVEAFSSSESFTDKATATRLQIMCILYLNNYFFGECNMERIRIHCKDAVNRLLSEASVRSAIRDEFETVFFSLSSKSNRLDVFNDIADLFKFVGYYASLKFELKDSHGKTVDLVNVNTKFHLNFKGQIHCLAISGNILYLSHDSTIEGLDISTHSRVTSLLGHSSNVVCLAVSGYRLYSGSADGIKVWNLMTHSEVASILLSVVSGFVVSNSRLYFGSYNGVEILDLSTMSLIISLPLCDVCSLAIDETRLYCSARHVIKVWDLSTFSEIFVLPVADYLPVTLLLNGYRLFYGNETGIFVWDVSNFSQIASWSIAYTGMKSSRELFEEFRCFYKPQIVISGNRLYSAYYNTIKVWDLSNFSEIATLKSNILALPVTCLAVSGTRVYFGSLDGTLRWNFL